MMIQMRWAQADDAAALANVEIASWRAAYRGLMPDAFLDGQSPAEQAERWRQNLLKHAATGLKRVIVAVHDQQLVGFIRVGRMDDGIGNVYLLYISPAYWSGGIGTRLMQAGMDELRDLGVSEAILWVLRENGRARRFYEHLGWQANGQTSINDYGGVELVALCYRLAVG